MASRLALALLITSVPAAAPPGAPLRPDELAPLFGGAEAAALAGLEAGGFAAAAAALAREPRPEARFPEALALVGDGRPELALDRLAGLEDRLPDLSDRIRLLRARALERAGRASEAAAAYGTVPAGSLGRAEALLARARLLTSAGDGRAALEALGPLLGLSAPDDLSRPDAAAQALLMAAQIRAAGPEPERDAAAARQDYLQCWSAHPLSPAAPRCRDGLRALPEPLSGAVPPGDALRRAEILLESNRNRAAIAELTPLLAQLGGADACRARLDLGRALRKERRHLKALEVLRPAVAECPDAPGRPRALHALAASAAVAAPAEAVERYQQLARDYPDHPLADDALYFAADLLARAGRNAEARALLAAIVERYPRGDYRAEAGFRLAWLEWRTGDRGAALVALARVQAEYEESDPYEFARATYWRARILAARRRKGDAAAALALWGLLVERHPADYYGLLARARLSEARGVEVSWSRPPAGGEASRDPGGLRRDPHFRAGLLLLRMGLLSPAAEELRAVDRGLLAPGEPYGSGPLQLLADLLDRAGDHRAAHGLVRSVGRQLLRQRPDGVGARLWRIAFPPAWRDEVLRAAPPAGVPPDLLQAMMREESALDPAAVSAAGAVGLTQLMLPTAQAQARKLKLGRSLSSADLQDGPLNIRLGAAHLGEVLQHFGGSAPLAVAAYNAGEAAVRGWLRERGQLPLDEFVEEMPVQETRGYVKRVLRSYAAYRLLYGGPGDLPVALGQRLPAPR